MTAADRKVHVLDSETGKEISAIQLGGATSASPSMYELNGRQYLLVTAEVGGGGRGGAPVPTAGGPTGITAYALPN